MVGWTSTVRDVPDSIKKQVVVEYQKHPGWPGKDVEIDHFISLELGGSNDIKNLWPEPYTYMVNGKNMGARQKDVVENYLHREVKAGRMTLARARQDITTDWVRVYQSIK